MGASHRFIGPRVVGALVVVAAIGASVPAPRSDAQDAVFQLRFDFDGPDEQRAFLDCVPRGTTDFRMLRRGVPTSELRDFNDCVAEIQKEQGIETIVRQRIRRGNLVRNQWTFRSFLTQEQVEKLKAFDIDTPLFNNGIRVMVSMPPEPAPLSLQALTVDPIVSIDDPEYLYLTGIDGVPIVLWRGDYTPTAWANIVESNTFSGITFPFPPTDGKIYVDGVIKNGARSYAPLTAEQADAIRAFLDGPFGSFQDGQFVYPFAVGGTFNPDSGRPIRLELNGTVTFAIDRAPEAGPGEVPFQIIGFHATGTSRLGDVVLSGGPHLQGPTVTAIRGRGRSRVVGGDTLAGTLQIGADSGDFEFDGGFRMIIPWRRLRRFTGIRVRGAEDVLIGGLTGPGGPGDIDDPPVAGGTSGKLRLRRVRFGRYGRARFDPPGEVVEVE